MTIKKYLIWWLSQSACEELEPLHRTDSLELPDYILEQYVSRYGRNGRGRLWVSPGIEINEITWPDDDENAVAQMASNCGGIVILKADTRQIAFLPGFVTDLSLNLHRME